MTGKLNGKVAIITGASSGIGEAAARVLAAEGANLVITARREEKLSTLVNDFKLKGTKAIYVVGDASKEETALQTVEAAMKEFGRIDILINNTGIGNYKELVDTSAAEYDEMMITNMRSTFFIYSFCCPFYDSSSEWNYFNNFLDGWNLWLSGSSGLLRNQICPNGIC